MKKKKYFSITFCCSEDEQQAIKQTAKDCGLSVSNYCNRVILGYKPKYRLTADDVELMQDVRKVTSDLQRMANFFNQSNHQMVVEELKKIINKLKPIVYDRKG